jgi:hypothetical protein
LILPIEKVAGKNTKWSPVITGRIAVTLADPEMDIYKLGYLQSYFGKRKGITLAVNATSQGETELFRNNNFYGADLLFNFKRWDLIAEYNLLNRNSFTTDNQVIYKTSDNLFSVKLGYNLPPKS